MSGFASAAPNVVFLSGEIAYKAGMLTAVSIGNLTKGGVCCWLVVCCGMVPLGAGAVEPVRFSRDVLPILSDKCFQCHGPDADARKAKLRFELEAAG